MKDTNLLQYLETCHRMNTQGLEDEKDLAILQQIEKARSNLKQVFDISNSELIELLEVELTLLGIEQDCGRGVFTFIKEQEHLGSLFMNVLNQNLRWADKDYTIEEKPLYSVEEVIAKIRKEILNV